MLSMNPILLGYLCTNLWEDVMLTGFPLQSHCSIWPSDVWIKVGERTRPLERNSIDGFKQHYFVIFCISFSLFCHQLLGLWWKKELDRLKEIV